jgi:hypothetical protein
VGQYMAPMEPRVSGDTLSSACFARRCSSSWDLVAPRHGWPLAPREQVGIGHTKGVGGFWNGVTVATPGCVGDVWWTGGQPPRGRAAGGAVAGLGVWAVPTAMVGEGKGGGTPGVTRACARIIYSTKEDMYSVRYYYIIRMEEYSVYFYII